MSSQPGSSAALRMAKWAVSAHNRPLPDPIRGVMDRLLVNGLAASAAGAAHPGMNLLRDSVKAEGGSPVATVLWTGERVSVPQAALVNAAMMEVLDFNETHLEAFVHPTSPVCPADQATAESRDLSLDAALRAAAIGIEAELAIATAVMPSHYEMGFNPAVAAGAIGAAVGSALVADLPPEGDATAISLAALSGAGPLESLGTMHRPVAVGNAARTGAVSAVLAAGGIDAPETAIEGENGVIRAFSREDLTKLEAIIDTLGEDWRIAGNIAFKRYPTETITQAPLEAILQLRGDATDSATIPVPTLIITVHPLVAGIAAERRRRFSVPASDLEARFDMSYCLAAAWCRGRFTQTELGAEARSDRSILAVRSRIEFVANDSITMAGGAAAIQGPEATSRACIVEAFTGRPHRRLRGAGNPESAAPVGFAIPSALRNSGSTQCHLAHFLGRCLWK